ncbi:hypothetical protein VNO77_42582 [Canavalia gladiata]|uniref:Uncharacterized protein n=1 Tax=Canavalia gladiata TaxID=3824 RepID=A0AAN9JVB9_CANGL
MQHTHSGTERGDRRSRINSHLEAHHANPFGEAHPSPFRNYSAPTSSSSQNPFLMPSHATNTTHVGATKAENLHDHLHSLPGMQQEHRDMKNNGLSTSMSTSTYESPPGNPFEAPTYTTNKESCASTSVSWKLDEHHHDHGNESYHTHPSMEQGHWAMPSHEGRTHPTNTHDEAHASSSSQDPVFLFESTQNQQVANATHNNHKGNTIPTNLESHHAFSATGQGHPSNVGSNLGTDTELGSSMSSYSQASESSFQDPMHNSVNAATKSPQKLENELHLASESNDDDIPFNSYPKHGQPSSVAAVPSTSNGSEKQNPPVQVMERPENPSKSSRYKFPSHVFARHKSNTQWSTASNESLFSIQMGNMSFSSEMVWLSKSGDMDKIGDANSSSAFPNNQQPPLPPHPQTSPTKFNNISQITAKQHEGSKVTEEQAAETMREVIMENSVKKQNTIKGDLTAVVEATASHNHPHHSNGSTTSFAFDVFTDGDKNLSSKRGEDKKKQQKQPESPKVTPDEAQNPKSTPNASQNKWLSCFSCCS